MFQDFDPQIFFDSNFKEDSVREVIIAPMLTRLGYHPTGDQTIVRSKALAQPFIYVGTRRHPVTIIPDYTLYFQGRPVLILEAKSPSENVTLPNHVQQAYIYAIHPEVRVNHFALCNGQRLVIYSVGNPKPLLDISYEEFESRWEGIERFLKPKYLINLSFGNLHPTLASLYLVWGWLSTLKSSFSEPDLILFREFPRIYLLRV